MNSLLTVANWVLPLLYLALMVDYGATFFLRVRVSSKGRGIGAVVLVHAAFFVLRAAHLRQLPLTNAYDILSLVALSTAAVYWLLERAGRDRRAGLFVFLLVFLFQYTASVFLAHTIGAGTAVRSGAYGWDQLHVIPAVLAYTAISLAGVYGVLELVTQRNLKRHRFGLLFDRLPPVELLGKMIWCALLVGFCFLTISVATGPFLFAHSQPNPTAPFWKAKVAVKIILGSIAWVICLTALAGKILRRWPIRTVSVVAVIDFVTVLALLISSAVLS